MLLANHLKHKLAQWRSKQLLRQQRAISYPLGTPNQASVDGLKLTDFTSNDYLGLRYHEGIAKQYSEAALTYGLGSGASALISGYSPAHQMVEEQFAEWLGVDRALLLSSGYLANAGLYSCLMTRHQHILADKLCHSSIIDGITLSRAQHHRYPHHDLAELHRLATLNTPDFIVSESVFSMEGDIAPVEELKLAAQQYQSGLIIDDAHGIGILGVQGRGVIEHFAMSEDDYSCIVYPLGKAFNAMGAIIAGNADIIESVIQFSKTYRYNTALPPAVCVGVSAALEAIKTERWRREQLFENIGTFNQQCQSLGLPLIAKDPTPIRSLMAGSNAKAVQLQQQLKNAGFNVYATRPPTVPEGSARLRISLNSLHSKEQIIQLLTSLAKAYAEVADE